MGVPSINVPTSNYGLDSGVANAMNASLVTTEPLAITVMPSYSHRSPFPGLPTPKDTVPCMAAHQFTNLYISNHTGASHSEYHEQGIMANATIMTEASNVQENSVDNNGLIDTSISPAPVTAQFTSADATSPIAIADSPQKRPHFCSWPNCHKAFTRSAHLTRHTRSHGGEKPYACLYVGCGKQFSRSDVLKEHIRTHDVNKVRKRKARMPIELIKDVAAKKPNLTITAASTAAAGPDMSSALPARQHPN
ncbi:hypothetical protein BG011_005560 [Mortierella polycephala]|uniref:C2H2-type domain-containing protein n=1 Tax=Mortierella polycephala TaxID=41804 RepID=A0A9P6U0Q6_9FUNG|nr:hypothetical protein BG011_005560 [Mortierella polycephala]